MRKQIFYFLLLLFPIFLHSQAYQIKDYDIEIDLNQDGSFDVNETIEVQFNEKQRGIYRNIPRSFKMNGKKLKTKLSNVEVKDHKFKILRENNDHIIRMGDKNTYLEGSQLYDFSYTVSNAYLFEDDHIAFQYNLIHEWDTEIEKVSYNINLPENLNLATEDFTIFTGKPGNQNQHVSVERIGRRIFGKSLTKIPEDESVTVAIRLPVDYIAKPTAAAPVKEMAKKDKFWMIPILFLISLFSFFFNKRKMRTDVVVNPQYYPPSDLSPAEVGAYHDNVVNTEDMVALLPYWANKGWIKIMSGTEGNLFFQKLSNLPSDSPRYQSLIFDSIFKKEDMILLSELKENMYKSIYKASKEIKKSILNKELYDSGYYSTFKTGKMFFLSMFSILVGILSIVKFNLVFTGIACFIFALLCLIIHFLPAKKSEKGEVIKHKLEYLKSFLKTGDQESTKKLLRDNPRYFEDVFPYAIALGVDKDWMARIKDFDVPEPHWYGYHGVTNNGSNSNNLNSFSKNFDVKEIKSVFVSAPAPKNGSGSGGGFSGGAGGGFGGGGGSW